MRKTTNKKKDKVRQTDVLGKRQTDEQKTDKERL